MRSGTGFFSFLSAAAFTALCAYILALLSQSLGGSSVTLETVTIRQSIELEGIALRREETIASRDEIMLLCTSGGRIPAGGIVAQAGQELIKSTQSAIFFEDTDGFEYLSPQLEGFSAQTPGVLMHSEKNKAKSCGRLVTGRDWYIAAYIDAPVLPEGKLRLRLEGIDEELHPQLVKTESVHDGRCAVLLRLSLGRAELLRLRLCRGELVIKEYTGLEIPERALLPGEDGGFMVKIINPADEEFHRVDIIYNEDGKYLAEADDKLKEGVLIRVI